MRTRLVSTLPALLLALVAIILAVVGLVRYNDQPAATSSSATGQVTRSEPAGEKEPEKPTFTYLFAKEDIEAGTELKPELFSEITTTVELQGALAKDSATFGEAIPNPLKAGAPLTDYAMEDASILQRELPEGIRAVAFDLNPLSGIGGLLRPGDLVDVVATFKGNSADSALSTVLLREVEVLAMRGTTDPSGGADDDDRRRNSTMVLAVPEAEVNRLALASAEANLRFVATRRGVSMAEPVEGDGETEVIAQADQKPQEPEAIFLADIRPLSPEAKAKKEAEEKARRQEKQKETDNGLKVQIFEGSDTRTVYVR
jgi:pilus assembly protein CpaB